MMPRYVDSQPATMPVEPAHAASEFDDADRGGPDGSGIVWAVIAGLVVLGVVVSVLLALRGGR